jgi:hypothetical protein
VKLTYGADFEMFLMLNDEVKPICGLLGGTKDQPLQIPGAPPGYLYQEDGVTAEFNVPVTDSPTEFVQSLRTAMDHAKRLVKEKIGKKARLLPRSAWSFPMEYLTPHPEAMRAGCDPDYQCYFEGRERDAPDITAWGGWRFAGFHIHIGYDTIRLPEWMMALVLDQYLFRLVSDSCYDRNNHYPRGIFRPKPYGVEYRGLGSSHLDLLPDLEMRLNNIAVRLADQFSATVDGCLNQKDSEADILLGGTGRIGGRRAAGPRPANRVINDFGQGINDLPRMQVGVIR